MAYVLVQDGVVVQKQPNYDVGFVEAPETVICGFLFDGKDFSEPPSPEPVPVLRDIPRPSFLFMMSKMGITETQVEGLISAMPAGDARDLALIVFKNQQTFKRDNSLLKTLTKAAGLTDAQVDTAWRAAEQLTW